MLMNFALGSKGIVFFEWEDFVWPRSTMVVYRKPKALELEILLGESKAKCAGVCFVRSKGRNDYNNKL